jgi:hypothetical protein
MAFPTRHWRRLQALLAPGQAGGQNHGLRSGMAYTSCVPDAVLFEMGVSTYDTWPNEQIGKWAADDDALVFLSNWDSANAHRYSVIARCYYSEDDQNF